LLGIAALNLREIIIQPVQPNEQERFQCLMKTHHYLGALPKIGHTLWYVASYQARQDFSRKLKWIRPILAAKNDLAINAYGCPRSSSVRHDAQLRLARCVPWLP
jgi:hypothetical protein